MRLTCIRSITAVGFVLAGALLSATAARADVSDVFLRVEAESSLGSGAFEILTEDVDFDPDTGTWSWRGNGMAIMDGDVEIAMFDQGALTIVGDPQIGLTFAVQAGAVDTNFTITTALLDIQPDYNNPNGLINVSMTATDIDGNEAHLVGNGPGGGAYLGQYNGLVPGGTTFGEFIQSIDVLNPNGSNSTSDGTGGFVGIPGIVSDMSAQIAFSLTANDTASGSSIYVIVPEPAAMLLLAVGGLLLRRR